MHQNSLTELNMNRICSFDCIHNTEMSRFSNQLEKSRKIVSRDSEHNLASFYIDNKLYLYNLKAQFY